MLQVVLVLQEELLIKFVIYTADNVFPRDCNYEVIKRWFHLIKKAISPVVATALLLVVAVVAVVGFQTWFNTYQTGFDWSKQRVNQHLP